MTNCILLNADYSFLNFVDWKRAVGLIVKGKVQVLKYSERCVSRVEGKIMRVPAVMKLVKLIRILYRTRVPFSKRNVLIRDGFKCAYCGNNHGKLTLDHIIPKSRGGQTTFENCVSSCKICNGRKGNHTPREARMVLRVKPIQPTISEFLRMKSSKLNIHQILKDLGIY